MKVVVKFMEVGFALLPSPESGPGLTQRFSYVAQFVLTWDQLIEVKPQHYHKFSEQL